MPIIEFKNISQSTLYANSSIAFSPPTTFVVVSATLILSSFALSSSRTAQNFGLNSLICSSSLSISFPAVIALTFILCFLATSILCVPIDPVEPNIAILFSILSVFFILTPFSFYPNKRAIPNKSNINNTNGAVAITESNLSRTPPCPGIMFP